MYKINYTKFFIRPDGDIGNISQGTDVAYMDCRLDLIEINLIISLECDKEDHNGHINEKGYYPVIDNVEKIDGHIVVYPSKELKTCYKDVPLNNLNADIPLNETIEEKTKKQLTYKGYTGTIEVTVDNKLYGQILNINEPIYYEGNTIGQVKLIFENKIDNYILKQKCNKKKKITINGIDINTPLQSIDYYQVVCCAMMEAKYEPTVTYNYGNAINEKILCNGNSINIGNGMIFKVEEK